MARGPATRWHVVMAHAQPEEGMKHTKLLPARGLENTAPLRGSTVPRTGPCGFSCVGTYHSGLSRSGPGGHGMRSWHLAGWEFWLVKMKFWKRTGETGRAA